MAQIYTNSSIGRVFFQVGRNPNSVHEMRAVKAPFDLVKINGKTYLQPCSFIMSSSAMVSQGVDNDAETAFMLRQEFYDNTEPVVIRANQMGDLSDNWMGMNRFAWI